MILKQSATNQLHFTPGIDLRAYELLTFSFYQNGQCVAKYLSTDTDYVKLNPDYSVDIYMVASVAKKFGPQRVSFEICTWDGDVFELLVSETMDVEICRSNERTSIVDSDDSEITDSRIRAEIERISSKYIPKNVSDKVDELDDKVAELDEKVDTNLDEAIENWYEEHPEATTRIADGSITVEKLSTETVNELTTTPDGSITVGKFASSVVDDTLAEEGHPADAKAVGDAISDINNETDSKLSILQNIQTINPTGWIRASITSTTGATSRNWNDNRAFLQNSIPENVVTIDILEDISAVVLAYSETEYIGEWDGSNLVKAFRPALRFDMAKIRSLYPEYHYYLLVYSSPTDAHAKVQFTIRNDIPIQDKSIYTSDSYSAIANVAESYFKVAFDENDEFGYDNLYGLYCDNAEDDGVKKINCSQFVYALLTGTYYQNSKYARSENTPSTWGWQSDGTGTSYKPSSYEYEDFMYSQYMAKYFADKGLLVEYDPDHHHITKGDLIFVGDTQLYPTRHYNVGHVAIVFDVVDDRYVRTFDGGGGMTRTYDEQSTSIGIKRIDLTSANKRYFFVKNPLPNITVKHDLIVDAYCFGDEFSVSAGVTTTLGVAADLDRGIYTAVIETSAEGDPLLEERLNVYYADGLYDSYYCIGTDQKKVIPFFVQKKGLVCPMIWNAHADAQSIRANRVRIYKGAIAYLDE